MDSTDTEQLRHVVAEACAPVAQYWPMKTFAYRNPLRGFEHLPFDTAVRKGKHLLGGNGYVPNDDYRRLYRQGRISEDAVQRALERVGLDLPTKRVTLPKRAITSTEVLRLHLRFGLDPLDPALLTWHLTAGAATTEFRQDLPATSRVGRDGDASYVTTLWNSTLRVLGLCDAPDPTADDVAAQSTPPEVELPSGRTLSDWLDLLAGASLVEQVNDQMIKWGAAFLDEGMAGWQMPGRQEGFYHAWKELAQRDYSGRFLGIRKFASKVRSLSASPEDAVAAGLSRLGIPPERWTDYLSRLLAQLPGWVGFIRWRAENPEYPAQKHNPIDPVQYLAVRLFYEVELVQAYCHRELKTAGTLPALVHHWESRRDEYSERLHRNAPVVDRHTQAICRDAWRLFHLAQFLELTPQEVEEIPLTDARTLLGWLDAFPTDRHGPVWLDALESSYEEQLVKRLSAHVDGVDEPTERPRAQLVFCIDVRSESFRRHIESEGPYDTYGFAGFFGVAIRHNAFDSAAPVALCPVIVQPGFAVHEVPRSGEDKPLRAYSSGSRWSQLGDHLFHDLKRNPVGSFMLIDALGFFFGLRLLGKTLFGGAYQSIATGLRRWFCRPVATQIPVDLLEDQGADLPQGLSSLDQAAFVQKGLRAMGLTRNFARLVVLCGHGSTSENNPYFAAYQCGACGGNPGDPNARVFASMANKPEVRQALQESGLSVPEDTWFLGGKHDTTTDEVTFYDVADVPASHTEELRLLKEDLAKAGAQQALERCHRIPRAPTKISPEKAHDHVVARGSDWANVRPEWGLSSHAAFIIGKRALTRGLDLGGRVFLHSYDTDADAEGEILQVIMTAPLVVGQWINMEYYFSAADPWSYGSGSKVTHNVVSGVGVMHGAHGDLQTGLPLQSVNDGASHYHEPMRLLAVIEAPTSRIAAVIQKHALLQHLFHNEWIHLVALDPATREFHRYHTDATWHRVGGPTDGDANGVDLS